MDVPCRYEVEQGTQVGFPQLIASYAAPSTSRVAGEIGAAAATTPRNTGPGSLDILGEIISKLIVTPSLDQLGSMSKAREDCPRPEDLRA